MIPNPEFSTRAQAWAAHDVQLCSMSRTCRGVLSHLILTTCFRGVEDFKAAYVLQTRSNTLPLEMAIRPRFKIRNAQRRRRSTRKKSRSAHGQILANCSQMARLLIAQLPYKQQLRSPLAQCCPASEARVGIQPPSTVRHVSLLSANERRAVDALPRKRGHRCLDSIQDAVQGLHSK